MREFVHHVPSFGVIAENITYLSLSDGISEFQMPGSSCRQTQDCYIAIVQMFQIKAENMVCGKTF